MIISGIIRKWAKDETNSQKTKLKDLQNATNWQNVTGFSEYVSMREELVSVCEKHVRILAEMAKKINEVSKK